MGGRAGSEAALMPAERSSGAMISCFNGNSSHVRPRRKIVDHRQERQRGPRRQQRDVEHAPMPHAQRMTIDQPNHVWCADVTYIPMRRGFLYLVAIMDWASRKVLAWRLSNTMDAEFCVAALEDAITRFGKPDIFNTDQGSQFTSFAFTNTLKDCFLYTSDAADEEDSVD